METARTRQTPRALQLLLVVTIVLTALFTTAAPTVLGADAWAGTRYCGSFQTCQVQSYATGTVYHRRCDTQFNNCVLKASWSNGGTFKWRTSLHGSGSQGVTISTTGTLTSQYATCVCTQPQCPE